MRLASRVGIVVALTMVSLTAGNVQAEGFWSRLNPFRFFQSSDAVEATTIEDRQAMVRERLAERGLSQEDIDARLAQIETARESGVSPFGGGERPSLDDIRAKLEERGIDAATIDARVADITAARESGTMPSFRNGDGAPSTDDLRARLEERGLSAEEIDDRIARIEEARANREAGGGEMPADFEERMARFREMMAARRGG